jgi:hypothetical protein
LIQIAHFVSNKAFALSSRSLERGDCLLLMQVHKCLENLKEAHLRWLDGPLSEKSPPNTQEMHKFAPINFRIDFSKMDKAIFTAIRKAL